MGLFDFGTLRGTASNVRHAATVSGGGNDTGVSTSHTAICQLDGKAVIVAPGELTVLNNGDDVAVIGKVSGGTFRACGYRNLTSGAEACNASYYLWFIPLWVTLFFSLAVGVFANILVALVPIALFGGGSFWYGLQMRRAQEALRILT